MDKIYREVAPGLETPQNASEESIQERADNIAKSGCFGPVILRRFPWSRTYRTMEYLGLLNTYSDHLRLPDQTLKQLLDGVAVAIEAQGGTVVRNYVAVLFIAQKLP